MGAKSFRSGELVRQRREVDGGEEREGVAVRPGGMGRIVVRWKDNGEEEAVAAALLFPIGKHEI